MDPNATLRMIDEASRVDAETREAIQNLRHWLSRGGFAPDWAEYPTGTRRFRRALGVKNAGARKKKTSSRQHATKKTTKRPAKKTSSRRRSLHAHATTARAFPAVTVPPAVLHGGSVGVGDIVKRADRDDKNRYVVTEIRGPWVFTQRISGSGSPGVITFPSALMLKKVG
jgi:hypothetical protein